MSAPASCGLTVLRARGRRLCKAIHQDGTMLEYDQVKLVDLEPVHLASLIDLHALLCRLAGRHDCCVVRGAAVDPTRVLGVRRLLHADAETGDLATLREEPRRWVALDLDSVPMPPSVDLRDLAVCARAVVPLLPAPFHQAAVVVSATASHGLKPGARLRLWFWCDRPLTGAECKRWLAGAPVDRTVFGAAQPIYTAHPLFIGRGDHLQRRLVMLDGCPVVQAPTVAALAPAPRQHVGLAPCRLGGDVLGRLAGLIRTVRGASEGQRHTTLFWAACRAGELVADGVIGPGAAAAALVQSAMDGGGRDERKAAATARDGIARGMMEGSRHG